MRLAIVTAVIAATPPLSPRRPAGSAQKLLQVLATCRTAPTYC
jgi:hypothetical protein